MTKGVTVPFLLSISVNKLLLLLHLHPRLVLVLCRNSKELKKCHIKTGSFYMDSIYPWTHKVRQTFNVHHGDFNGWQTFTLFYLYTWSVCNLLFLTHTCDSSSSKMLQRCVVFGLTNTDRKIHNNKIQPCSPQNQY